MMQVLHGVGSARVTQLTLALIYSQSHFYSSHWCMFGFETVGVLLLCIASAYLVGSGCGLLITAHFG